MPFQFPAALYANRADDHGRPLCWDSQAVHTQLGRKVSARTVERALGELLPNPQSPDDIEDEQGRSLNPLVRDALENEARRKRHPSLILQTHKNSKGHLFMANDGRGGRKWFWHQGTPDQAALLDFLDALARHYQRPLLIWPSGALTPVARRIQAVYGGHQVTLASGGVARLALTAYGDAPGQPAQPAQTDASKRSSGKAPEDPEASVSTEMTHLDRLEAESMHIIREVMAEAENPVMLYSIGKDSSVMLRLAEKAFYPSKPPFPLMHIDTRWKFRAMYEFRDQIARQTGMELIVHINPDGVRKNVNPFDHGSALHTDVMKTQALIQALDKHGFDAAFGGARRDEEKSRAKERVFSFRNNKHRWDPKNQRPELWNLYNGRKAPGESMRVFPLSNWTELDIWQYIYREQIPIVPLYFAAERPVIERDGMLMQVDDERLKLFPGEKIHTRRVRFRTLGCYPLTGAFESDADTLPGILLELLEARTSERQGRAIDKDSLGSMEKKKQEGYF